MKRRNSLVSDLLTELAAETGIKLLIEPEFGYAGRIITPDHRVFYFHSTKFDINRLGASEIAEDKDYASFFMSQLGHPVPEGKAFYSDEWCWKIKSSKNSQAAVHYAEQLGFPVIVKPNSESQGRVVEKVYAKEDLLVALSYIFNHLKDKVALVQKVVAGNDYRIVVLENEVLCAYQRTPLSVTGDGKKTIRKLLEEKQSQFENRGRDTVINLNDQRIERILRHEKLLFTTVLTKNKTVQLLANANLSSGGEAVDVTSSLHEDYKKMAIRLTRDMGLTYSGIDIMTKQPINKSLKDYTVIEINAAPGLDYYAETGSTQRQIVKVLYKKLLLHMVRTHE